MFELPLNKSYFKLFFCVCENEISIIVYIIVSECLSITFYNKIVN